MRFYNLPNDYAALYANEKKSAEDIVKRMEMLAIQYKDNEFMAELNKAFPTLVQKSTIDLTQQVPNQIFR